MKLKGGGGTLTSNKYLVEGNGPIDGENRTPNILWYDDTMTLSTDTLKGMVNLQGFCTFFLHAFVCLFVCVYYR